MLYISAVYKTVYKIRYTSIISTSAVGNRVVVNKESLTRLQSFMIWIFHASARRWDEIFNYDGVTIWLGRPVAVELAAAAAVTCNCLNPDIRPDGGRQQGAFKHIFLVMLVSELH